MLKMSIERRRAAPPLFRFIRPEGSAGCFWSQTINWQITHDGAEIARGRTDRASLDAGVKQYMSQRAQHIGESGVAKAPGRPREKEAAA
jgi:hypothetical protein